jgi:hypothetical protein
VTVHAGEHRRGPEAIARDEQHVAVIDLRRRRHDPEADPGHQRRWNDGSSGDGGVSIFSSGPRSTPGEDDLVDRIEHARRQVGVGGSHLRVQVLDPPRADDRAGGGRVGRHEAECELGHHQPCVVGDLRELLDSIELGPVDRDGDVETLRHERRAAGRDLATFADRPGQPLCVSVGARRRSSTPHSRAVST